MFKKPFSSKGRIRRLEYGFSIVAYALLIVFLDYLSKSGIYLNILLIIALWFLYAQGAKRCHDLGKNGWWQFIPFYPLFLLFQPGTGKLNEYGYPPRVGKKRKDMSSESDINPIGV